MTFGRNIQQSPE